jgi:nitrogen fixation-related uncharacterized protein
MSFVRFWLGFTMFGVAAAVALLVWALRSRQFREPDRAACLPLAGTTSAPPPVRWSRDATVLAGFLGVGLALLVVTLVLSLLW